jgi:hypothetical protein
MRGDSPPDEPPSLRPEQADGRRDTCTPELAEHAALAAAGLCIRFREPGELREAHASRDEHADDGSIASAEEAEVPLAHLRYQADLLFGRNRDRLLRRLKLHHPAMGWLSNSPS